MGVKDLWSILEPAGRKISLDALEGKILAVDLSCWILEGLKQKDLATSKRRSSYLWVVFCRTRQLIRYGARLVFVIEGTAPDIKEEKLLQRSFHHTKYAPHPRKKAQVCVKSSALTERIGFNCMLDECRVLLEALGMPYVKSKGEAEAMCALLNKKGLVHGCITEDSDALLYGSEVIYRALSLKEKEVSEYSMMKIKEDLKYDRKRLIAFALLLGCDYTNGICGVGKETAELLVKKLENEEDILERFKSWKTDNLLDGYDFQYLNQRERVHCDQCGHPGNEKMHTRNGCKLCGSTSLCMNNPTVDCSCEWHKVNGLKKELGVELSVRLKAQTKKDFPSQEVINEYLEYDDDVPSQLDWAMPNWSDFQKIVNAKFSLEKQKSWKYFFPLLTMWHLLVGQSSGSSVLNPIRINKNRKVEGKECYEVEWDVSGELDTSFTSKPHNTIESRNLFSVAHPAMANQFNQEKQQLKKRKGPKVDSRQRTISGMMLSTPKKSSEIQGASEDELDMKEMEDIPLSPKAAKIPTPSKRCPRTPKKTSGVPRSLRNLHKEKISRKLRFFTKMNSATFSVESSDMS